MPNRSRRNKKRDRGREREREGEREAEQEKRSCTMRNGTVDRCRVIQIGCDRCNPRFAIINSHPARPSSKSITGTHGWKIFHLVLRRSTRNHLVSRRGFNIPFVVELLLIISFLWRWWPRSHKIETRIKTRHLIVILF